MSSGVSWKVMSSVPTWRACLCLLLIVLVAYNPFAALNGSCAKLSCEKIARNRATIGSGELQHFSPVSDPSVQSDAALDVNCPQPPLPTPARYRVQDEPEVIPREAALLAGVWFRPPPLS
jgi:hypothetical protein